MLNYTSDIVIKRHSHWITIVDGLVMLLAHSFLMRGAIKENTSRIRNNDGKIISEWSH